MKTKTEAKTGTSRRDFLKTAGLATGAAAAAAVTTSKADAKSVDEPKSSGYQETDHVRTYYELARF